MSFSNDRQAEQEAEDAYRAEWQLCDYVDQDCEQCGRQRVCICPNGKHRCEKCNWCPEEQAYIDA